MLNENFFSADMCDGLLTFVPQGGCRWAAAAVLRAKADTLHYERGSQNDWEGLSGEWRLSIFA
jgi:hypothetical protein